MAFIVKKEIHGKKYYYLRESSRDAKTHKVKAKTIAYLGKTRKDAEKKMGQILKERGLKEKEKLGVDKKREINDGRMQDLDINRLTIKEKEVKKKTKEPKQINVEDMAMFCKRKGFVYLSGDIYGGLSGFFDFGPVGVELKNNIKNQWWNFHVRQRQDVVGIDGSIITHPKTWEASGHTKSFSDLIVKCKRCKRIGKIDKSELGKINCECGGEYDSLGEFNLMFKTSVGPFEDKSLSSLSYLRPETAQLIFTNFKAVVENARLKLPFGIAQIGKAFRNEIAPRDFLFRMREFEQMEIEYFVRPDEKSGDSRGSQKCPYKIPDISILIYSTEAQKKNEEPVKMKFKEALNKRIIKKDWHAYWLATEFLWFISLGANPDNFRIRQHQKDELAHYSSDCWDLEYNFPFGWKELQGIADRADYDLKQHEKYSGKDLKIFDEKTNSKILPHVICEPSLGVERAFLVFMFDAYNYNYKRDYVVLKLHPKLAPIKAGVFPLVKTDKKLVKISKEVYSELKQEFNVVYDDGGSIGRRYARADELAVPVAITIDGQSLKDKTLTLRDRNTTEQIRVKIKELKEILKKLINGEIKFEKIGKIVKTRVK